MMINKLIMFWTDNRSLENHKQALFEALKKIEPSKDLCNCYIRTQPLIRKLEFYEIVYPEQASKSVEEIIKMIIPYPTFRSFIFYMLIERPLCAIPFIKRWSSGRQVKGFPINLMMNDRSMVISTRKDKIDLSKENLKCPNCNGVILRSDI